MTRWLLTVCWMVMMMGAWAQIPTLPDSIAEAVESDALAGDTLSDPFLFALPIEYEYIPAEETPELVADRLSCIERTIPLTYNSNIHGFINFFTIRNREYTKLMLRREHLYFPIFEKYLAEYNLPDELKYLSIIESGLNPRAVSRASAVGLWQFMSFTGRYFGLHNDWYFDDRMDPEKSTEAACKYLRQLYSMFHNWELALAAYNSGPGTVKRAIRRSGYKKTFWEVYRYLPRETRSYVPQFVAIIYAMKYADEHNMAEGALEQFIPHDTLAITKFLHFDTFAKLTGTCTEELLQLNPSVRHNAIPDNGKKYIIRVPVMAKAELEKNRTSILDSASKVGKKEVEHLAKTAVGNTFGRDLVVYRVREGDALGLIAQRHRVRLDDLRKWNNLRSNMIRTGQRLNIWVLPSQKVTKTVVPLPVKKDSITASLIASPSGDEKTYVVQPGDTLWDISKKFQGLTIQKIKTLNNLKTNKLQPGMKLIVS
ncbi:MAG: transglycosylase SLT domain-containing protein [Cyclobacteriaceae bacterium]|nr:transglycosylase SLT domain-containing protein [Cyclobacteriaceae bacterium]